MTERLVFLFAGQGSQYPAMAAQLYRDEPVFRGELDRLDALVVRESGRSLLPLLLERGPAAEFEDVRDTHPAIVAVQLALVRTLAGYGVRPDAVLGLSLGEVAAATVAGAMSPATAVAFAVAQGAVFAGSCPPGSMLAVLNPPPGLAGEELPEGCELALRGPKQLVITGAEKAVSALAERFQADGVSCYRMPVRTGFHSAALDAAERHCLASPMNQRPLPLTLPMASCATGSVLTGSLGAGHLWRSVRGPIRFGEALAALISGHASTLIDLGPGGSLAGLTQSIGDQGVGTIAGCHGVLTPLAAGRARLPELLARLA